MKLPAAAISVLVLASSAALACGHGGGDLRDDDGNVSFPVKPAVAFLQGRQCAVPERPMCGASQAGLSGCCGRGLSCLCTACAHRLPSSAMLSTRRDQTRRFGQCPGPARGFLERLGAGEQGRFRLFYSTGPSPPSNSIIKSIILVI